MGWSFALYFCHEAVTHLASKSAASSIGGLLKERGVPPTLLPGRGILGVYVDTVSAFGGERGTSKRVLTEFEAECASKTVAIHTDAVGEECLGILGMTLNGHDRIFDHSPRRVWRLYLAQYIREAGQAANAAGPAAQYQTRSLGKKLPSP